MKKVLFILGMVAVMSACAGNKSGNATSIDSTSVDSVMVDSVVVDSIVADSLIVE